MSIFLSIMILKWLNELDIIKNACVGRIRVKPSHFWVATFRHAAVAAQIHVRGSGITGKALTRCTRLYTELLWSLFEKKMCFFTIFSSIIFYFGLKTRWRTVFSLDIDTVNNCGQNETKRSSLRQFFDFLWFSKHYKFLPIFCFSTTLPYGVDMGIFECWYAFRSLLMTDIMSQACEHAISIVTWA